VELNEAYLETIKLANSQLTAGRMNYTFSLPTFAFCLHAASRPEEDTALPKKLSFASFRATTSFGEFPSEQCTGDFSVIATAVSFKQVSLTSCVSRLPAVADNLSGFYSKSRRPGLRAGSFDKNPKTKIVTKKATTI
jgi:hypothetical protein